MLTQLAQMGMSIIDLMFAGRVSAVDMAGIGLGASLFWPSMLLTTGVLFALTPTIAQLYGAGRTAETGVVAQHGGWIGVVGVVVVSIILYNAEFLYGLFKVDPEAIPIAVGYLHAQAFGLVGLFGYYVLRNLCEGMALTTPAMAIGITCLLLKVPLNYIFVMGAFGIEGMGGIGCGVSTAILFWVQFIAIGVAVYTTRIRLSRVFEKLHPPDFREIFRLVKLGLPIGLGIFAEVSFFSGTVILIGRFGAETVSAHNAATSFAGVAFMVPLAIAMSSTIRIGNHLGARRPDSAMLTVKVAIGTALVFACLMAVVMLVGRSTLATIYTNDVQVLTLSATLFLYCALFQLFDCAQVVLMGCLRGYKDTTKPMFIAIGAYWGIGMPIGLIFGLGWLDVESQGVVGFWWGICAGLIVASISLGIRALRTSRAFASGRKALPET